MGLLELKIKATWEVGTSHKRAFLDIAAFAARTDPSNSALESWWQEHSIFDLKKIFGPGKHKRKGGGMTSQRDLSRAVVINYRGL